jgi:hypothetical protein
MGLPHYDVGVQDVVSSFCLSVGLRQYLFTPDYMGKALAVAIYLALVRASWFGIFPTTDNFYQTAILHT